MLRYALLALVVCPLMAREIKIDHVTVAGRDLKAMQHAFEAIGLSFEYGGRHSNHATEMALTSFPDGSYLELMGIQSQAEPKALMDHTWHRFLESNSGPCAWATRPEDLAKEVARLRAAGLSVTEPLKNGRRRPDGVELEWETAQVGSGNGTFYPFLIRDFTPRERRAFPSGEATVKNLTGITKVVIAVRNLERAIKLFQRAYGLSAPKRYNDEAFGAKLAWFPDSPVILAAPLDDTSWIAERLRVFGETPCAFILGRGRGASYATKSDSEWFGNKVSWFDPSVLGWRLGLE